MLNFRAGHLVAGGDFECEECMGVGQAGGVVQTPEHWLGECEVLEDYWREVGQQLGSVNEGRVRGRWDVLRARMLGGVGNEWLTLGWIVAVWVGMAGHWLAVFEEGRKSTQEEKMARWWWLMKDILTGWQRGWGPGEGGHRKLVEVIYSKSEGQVQVIGNEVVFERVEVGEMPSEGVG